MTNIFSQDKILKISGALECEFFRGGIREKAVSQVRGFVFKIVSVWNDFTALKKSFCFASGTESMYRYFPCWRVTRRVCLVFGEPIKMPSKLPNKQIEELADHLAEAIADLDDKAENVVLRQGE